MKGIFALSVAGFDPSGGAGVLSDVRTFESEGVRGLAVSTAITFQTDDQFFGVEWLPFSSIYGQLAPLFERYSIVAVKIGLIQSLTALTTVLAAIRKFSPYIPIVWDPIVAASAGFVFHSEFKQKEVEMVLERVTVVTPNREEVVKLWPGPSEVESARQLSYLSAVILKGGHASGSTSEDVLFKDGQERRFSVKRLIGASRHGTGCVFSAALAARLALGASLEAAGKFAQEKVHNYLNDGGAYARH